MPASDTTHGQTPLHLFKLWTIFTPNDQARLSVGGVLQSVNGYEGEAAQYLVHGKVNQYEVPTGVTISPSNSRQAGEWL